MDTFKYPAYLTVDPKGRYLCQDNKPFFWLGDTAWLLFQSLTLEDSYLYLKNRKEKGFNIILSDFIHSLQQPNAYGDFPVLNDNFNTPDITNNYWKHIDQVIQIAGELGLSMALLPVWGSNLVKGGNLNSDNLAQYMDFILNRYGSYSHIIWLVGGDVRGDVNPEVFERMGAMFKANNPRQLVGYHPFGRTSSSQWFHEAAWLDFNMFQSGHRRYDQASLGAWDDNAVKDDYFGEDNWRYVEHDLSCSPQKPTLDGEPSYEQILQGLHDESQPYWTARDVRRYAYWSVFAGACGFTYGHNSVMQFYNDKSIKGAFGAKSLWKDALHHPGSNQMKHLADMMNSIAFTKGHAAQELLISPQGEKYDRISVFAGEDFILCYDYSGREFTLDLTDYSALDLKAYWFDPVSGVYSFLCDIAKADSLTVTPEAVDDNTDCLLVIKQ